MRAREATGQAAWAAARTRFSLSSFLPVCGACAHARMRPSLVSEALAGDAVTPGCAPSGLPLALPLRVSSAPASPSSCFP